MVIQEETQESTEHSVEIPSHPQRLAMSIHNTRWPDSQPTVGPLTSLVVWYRESYAPNMTKTSPSRLGTTYPTLPFPFPQCRPKKRRYGHGQLPQMRWSTLCS
jgi:hypothetical protein